MYIAECDSDIGARKINQDAVGVRQVLLKGQEAVFGALCDGLGGYESGETASAAVILSYSKWFEKEFCSSYSQMRNEDIIASWNGIIADINRKIHSYERKGNIKAGTTAVVLLLWRNLYYIMNIGDSRAYEITNEEIRQLTRDHSWVEGEVRAGRLSKEEARTHRRRNILLKCVGGSRDINVDFFIGEIKENAIYMLCSDGVRNRVTDEELHYFLYPKCMKGRKEILNNIGYIFELNRQRRETDNMSIAAVKVQGSGEKNRLFKRRRHLKKLIVNSRDKALLKLFMH